jgi:hypothetical protein
MSLYAGRLEFPERSSVAALYAGSLEFLEQWWL